MGFLFREGQARRDDEKRRAGNEILEVQRERFFGKLGNASRSRPKEIFFWISPENFARSKYSSEDKCLGIAAKNIPKI